MNGRAAGRYIRALIGIIHSLLLFNITWPTTTGCPTTSNVGGFDSIDDIMVLGAVSRCEQCCFYHSYMGLPPDAFLLA